VLEHAFGRMGYRAVVLRSVAGGNAGSASLIPRRLDADEFPMVAGSIPAMALRRVAE
jgi:hypothetical protein